MQIEQRRPTVVELTLHTYQLSALVAGARWAAKHEELPTDAQERLENVLEDYEAALRKTKGPQPDAE